MVYVNHLSRNGLNYHLQSQHTAARCVLNKRNVPFCSQNAFITLNADGLIAVMRQTTRSLQFWRRVLTIWASFKFTQANVTLQAQFRNADWQRRTWDRQHHRAADMMLDLCTSMKGFYVKAGQLIALQAFVPGVIRGKLSKLHDNMPAMSPELTRSVLETELHKLGQSLETFEDIDIAKSLLGSASIAQVHRAKLRNSKTEVAIKIQHKGMKELMMSDLANFRLLGEVLQRTELKFDLVSPVQELRRQIRLEFDFENEARAMMAIRKALVTQRGVTVPEMIPGLTSKSLLVMTFVDGTPMTRLGDVMNNRSEKTIKSVGKRILTRLGKSYATMILKDGFFQADCHPGNILVTNSKCHIAILDFGQTKQLTEGQRIGFACLVKAMAGKDASGVARYMKALGIETKHNDSGSRKEKLVKALTLEEKLAYTMFDTAAVEGVSDNPFSSESALREGSISSLPKDLVFLLRTMQILKGICKATGNDDFSMISAWKNAAEREVSKADLK